MLPSIALGGGKQPLNEWRPSSAKLNHFVKKPVWIHPQMGGGGHLCEILAKWGAGVYPDKGVNPRGYGIFVHRIYVAKSLSQMEFFWSDNWRQMLVWNVWCIAGGSRPEDQ